jgi:hypothetical protein
MAFNTKGVKGVRESTATLMAAVLSSTITTLKIPYLPAHLKASWKELNGMKMILSD